MASVLKMRIEAFGDRTFNNSLGHYDAMINPDKLTLDRRIKYNDQQAPDKSQASSKYKYSPAATLNFDLVLDCTGIVDSKRLDLADEIDQLLKLIYDYKSEQHRPAFVKITWGLGEPFRGVLTKCHTTYNLFDPDGVPLRATLQLSFSSYMDPKQIAKYEAKESPDMTHLVDVVQGDTLPGLSQRVYDNSDYTVQLAAFNGLNKFRQLKPGSVLTFPPIVPDDGNQGVNQ